PCGNFGHADKECICTPHQVRKYRAKLSEPLLDRIDLHLEVPALKISELTDEDKKGEPSSAIRKRVIKARNIQKSRLSEFNIYCNGQMGAKEIKKFCNPDKKSKDLLTNAIKKLNLSARAYDKILKISRTIADLDNKENIEPLHIAEAIQYRNLDRLY
ncbi:MAG: ATP-binding protein, partial [Endomicrobiales bacterium]|nr:ATP-binding protein [Endomicrobiales bacterium]